MDAEKTNCLNQCLSNPEIQGLVLKKNELLDLIKVKKEHLQKNEQATLDYKQEAEDIQAKIPGLLADGDEAEAARLQKRLSDINALTPSYEKVPNLINLKIRALKMQVQEIDGKIKKKVFPQLITEGEKVLLEIDSFVEERRTYWLQLLKDLNSELFPENPLSLPLKPQLFTLFDKYTTRQQF